MRIAALALGACLASLIGCGESRFKVIDTPFCTTDDPDRKAKFASHYVLLALDGDATVVSGFYGGDNGGSVVGPFSRSDARVVLIECAALVTQFSPEWAEQIRHDSVPHICPGQRLVFDRTLESVTNDRATALGYQAYLRFPKVDLACTDGEMIQSNSFTLGQILDDFRESVERYHDNHKALPPTFEALATNTKALPLPPDPWGTALRFESGASIQLTSAGPDKAFDSEDDIQVLTQRQSSSTAIMSFPGVGHSRTGDYRGLLRARDVE